MDYRVGRDLMTPIHKVIDGLFIGNRSSVEDSVNILTNDIKRVVQCLHFRLEFPSEKPHNVEVLHIKLNDDPEEDILRYVPEAIRFIHEGISESKNVLVHCNAGVSRSSSIVIAYLMATRNLSFREALHFVQEKRACADPNEGYTHQLETLPVGYLPSLL